MDSKSKIPIIIKPGGCQNGRGQNVFINSGATLKLPFKTDTFKRIER